MCGRVAGGALVLACCAAAADARLVADRVLGRELWERLHRTAGGRLMRVLEGVMFVASACLAVLMLLTAALRCWLGRRVRVVRRPRRPSSHPRCRSTAAAAAAGPETRAEDEEEDEEEGGVKSMRKGKKKKKRAKWPRAYPRQYLELLARAALEREAARAEHGRDPFCVRLRARHAELQGLQGACADAMAQARAALQALVARCAALDSDVAGALAARAPVPTEAAEAEEGVLAQARALEASRAECAALGARLAAADSDNRRLHAQLAAQLDEMTQLSNAVTRLQQRNAHLAARLARQPRPPRRRPEGPALPLFASTPSPAGVGPPDSAQEVGDANGDNDGDDGGDGDDDDGGGPAGYYLADLSSVPPLI